MSHQQKMGEAIQRAYDRGLISKEIMSQLPSVEELAIGIVVVGGVLVGLGVAAGAVASTGVGAVLEAIAAGIVLALAAIGIISSAKQVIAGIVLLVKFYRATESAQSYPELDAAGRDFAEGIAEVGVGTVMMILSYLGARQGLTMGQGALSKLPKEKPLPLPEDNVTPPPSIASDSLPSVSALKNVSTERDTAFFWSGRSGGIGGPAKAREIAESHNGVTLESLIEKRDIQMPNWDPKNPDSIEAWDDLSRQYAQGASGTVRAVIGDSLRPGSVWERIELPTLMNNPNVTRLIAVDPATGAEKVLMER